MANYRKIRKIILWSLAGLLAVIVLTASVCAIYANTSVYDKTAPSQFYSEWMKHISDTALLRDVVIPGSHDAGAYMLSWTAKTQDVDLKTQMEAGARYFDMRVEKYKDQLYIFHNERGDLLEPMLQQVKTFLVGHKTETIILDFQHFKGDPQEDLRAMITQKFDSSAVMLYNYSTTQDNEYLNNLKMSTARGRVIIFWGSSTDTDSLSQYYIFQRNDNGGERLGSALHSMYDGELNRMSSKDYIEKGLPIYLERYRKEGHLGLFVLQGQLTDGFGIFGPKFRERTHALNMDEYVKNMREWSEEELEYINIIMRDFVNVYKNSYALELNLFKNTVKSGSILEFAEELSQFIDVTYTIK